MAISNHEYFVAIIIALFAIFLEPFIYLYMNRTIEVREDRLLYSGFLIKQKIEYKNIKVWGFKTRTSYMVKMDDLIILTNENKSQIIKNIHLYEKEKIRFLLDLINKKTPNYEIELEKIIDSVNWLK